MIVSVYGGPLSQQVTKAAQSYLIQQWMADQGFIVVSIDGRGTPARGRAWERAIRGNLIEIPLRDQVATKILRAQAQRIGAREFVRFGPRAFTYAQMDAAAEHMPSTVREVTIDFGVTIDQPR